MSFPNGFFVDGTDFIAVDLRKDLPVRGTKVLPLGLGAFGAEAKLLGDGTAVVVHGHEEAVRGVGRAGIVGTEIESPVEEVSRMVHDDGVSGHTGK